MINIRTTALAALIFVVLYNLLFFHTQPGLGTGLTFLFLNFYFFTVKDTNAKNLSVAVLASIVSTTFAFLFILRASGVVQLIDIAAATFFSLVALYFYKYQGQFSFAVARFISLPLVVTGSSVGGFFKLFQADSWSGTSLEQRSASSLIRGLVITIPTFVVLLFLLVQADPIFNKLTSNIFSGVGERIVKSVIIFLGLLGLGLATYKVQEELVGEKIVEGKSHELIVIIGSVTALFAAFILVQFRYLFSSVGERELAELGINSLTYSEYVRKGFFELLIAASIACGLLLYVLRYFEKLRGKLAVVVHLFSTILTIETGFLLLSAVKRLLLYADAHGLTRARVFGFVFLVWLGILLIIFLVQLFQRVKQQWFFASVVVATLFVLMLVNIINIDGLIATSYKPTVNGEIDYYYIANLSPDAEESWQSAIEDAVATVSRLEGIANISPEQNRQLYYRNFTLRKLQEKIDYLLHKYDTKEGISWQAFNISEYLTYKKVAANRKFYEQIPVLLNKISVIESRVSSEVINNTLLDRSTQPPLIR